MTFPALHDAPSRDLLLTVSEKLDFRCASGTSDCSLPAVLNLKRMRVGSSGNERGYESNLFRAPHDGRYAATGPGTRTWADRVGTLPLDPKYIGIAAIWTLQSRSQTETTPHAIIRKPIKS